MKNFKKSAFVSMLVAYLIVLLHAVIPHHHHESDICILSTGYDIHNHCSHDETASGNTKHQECQLSQTVIVPSVPGGNHKIAGQELILQYALVATDVLSLKYVNPIEHIPDIINGSLRLLFYAQSPGLRAPPLR